MFFRFHSCSRLYAGHLEPLNGLFGFDLSSAGPYEGVSAIPSKAFRCPDYFLDFVQVAA